MANAFFYWYPDDTGTLESVDLGEGLSDLKITSTRVVQDAVNSMGGQSRAALMGGLMVNIVCERFSSRVVAQELLNMQTHLEQGKAVGFGADSSKIVCARTTRTPLRGDLSIKAGTNLFAAWNASAALAIDDWITVESPNPEMRREFLKIAAVTGTTYTATVKGSFTETPVIVRHHDFFPVLVMPQSAVGTPIVTHNHRITYTLDATLWLDYQTLFDLEVGELSGALAANSGVGRATLQQTQKADRRQDLANVDLNTGF